MSDNADQRQFWTDEAGPKWVTYQAQMDRLLQPVLDGVLERADLVPGQWVLDIGCGTGASTIQAAEAVGRRGRVTGIDISPTLLEMARRRAANPNRVSFIEADAADHDFGPGGFDRLLSRFGLMFFTDPSAAFANMASGLTATARVSFAAWGEIPANPYFTLAAQAARDVLGPMPKSDPDAPGPFAFRDPDRIETVLKEGGFRHTVIEVADIFLTPEGRLEQFADQSLAIGPAEAAMRHFDAGDDERYAIHERLQELFAHFMTPDGLRIPARINFATAQK